MTEIPGAWHEMARTLAMLREHLLDLATVIEPTGLAEVVADDGPTPVDPLRHPGIFHGRVAVETVVDDGHHDPAETAARAVEVLRRSGWQVGEVERASEKWVGVSAERDGATLDVSAEKDRYPLHRRSGTVRRRFPLVLRLWAQTAEARLYEDLPHLPPLPAVTPQTLTPGYALCRECDGAGWCTLCQTRGWYHTDNPDTWNRCWCWRGNDDYGNCVRCRGWGQLNPGQQTNPSQVGYRGRAWYHWLDTNTTTDADDPPAPTTPQPNPDRTV